MSIQGQEDPNRRPVAGATTSAQCYVANCPLRLLANLIDEAAAPHVEFVWQDGRFQSLSVGKEAAGFYIQLSLKVAREVLPTHEGMISSQSLNLANL